MKAMMLIGIRQMEMVEADKPCIEGENDVLLRMEVIGVCGSDVHYYETGRIGSQVVQYPYKVGHECSATVVEVGRSVRRVKTGDEVAVDPAVPCHECSQCRMGRENTCKKLRFLGTPGQADGCLCEYIVMPEESVYPISGRLTLEEAALVEPFTIGYYTVEQSGAGAGQCAAILGSGPIGLSVLLAGRAAGVGPIYVTDKIDSRCRAAEKAGACRASNPDKVDVVAEILEQQPEGVDVVYECAGEQETLDQAVELLRPGGKLVIVGIPRVDRISFDISTVRRKELSLINIRRQNRCVEQAIELAASGGVDLGFMLTHRFSFERSKEAFDLVACYGDGVIKAVIRF
ncbi:MAG: alcohol dehydrogenase catalytic domain-containing protein [Planctomycetota bacterium]